jgi:threonyl-tRNA synthetase
MAAAVQKLWPDVRFAGGPAIDDGFYYDFDMEHRITEEDFPAIEKAMRELIKSDGRFVRRDVSADEAREIFAAQPYKLEWINEYAASGADEPLSVYQFRDFTDLCRGPHVESSKELPKDGFKIRSVAGAYWKGDSKNKMLQRVYAYAFANAAELDQHIANVAEAEKRDHKKIGPALELFHFDSRSPGVPYWLPRGLIVYKELYRFWADYHEEHDYQEFRGTLLNKRELFVPSGHWDHYQDSMWIIKEDEDNVYALKPMSCPNSIVVYATKMRSYNDLPLRLSDADTLYRHESTGSLNGLFRTFEFNQDDAHIFVSPDQIEDEYNRIFDIVDDFYKLFGIKCSFNLSTRPDSFVGEKEIWDRAEAALEKILVARFGRDNFKIQEKDGAFYGPKVDINIKDALGREWQCGTIQLDFFMAGRFGITYTDRDGAKKTPIMIHRVIYGSLGRFIGILIEHFAGKLPLWISPVHAAVIPISQDYEKYADEVFARLYDADVRTATRGLRIEKSYSAESMQKRIRDAQVMQTPYMIIVGEKEQADGTISVRTRDGRQINGVKLDDFIAEMKEKIKTKTLEL